MTRKADEVVQTLSYRIKIIEEFNEKKAKPKFN